MKKLLSALLILALMGTSLIACKSDDNGGDAKDDQKNEQKEDEIVGTWVFDNIDIKELEEIPDDMIETVKEMAEEEFKGTSLEFKKDGKFTAKSDLIDEETDEEVSFEGEWKKDGDKVTVTYDEETEEEYVIKDGKLVMSDEEMTVTFKKK